jgi:hypothetical protein
MANILWRKVDPCPQDRVAQLILWKFIDEDYPQSFMTFHPLNFL